MAITGISAISGEQIIAAGAVSAKEAGKAYFTTGGNDIQSLYTTVSTNSASWTGGGAATLPVSGSAGDNSAVYGLYDMKIECNVPSVGGSEPEHTYIQAGTNSITVYESFDEDQSYNQAYIAPGYIEFYNNVDGYVNFGSTNVLNWNSTYETVSNNSASWTASGPTYTGDAQGALDEVYTNSGNWNTVTDKLNTTAFSTVSGDFLTAHQTLANSANWDSTYTTVSTNSASWGAGSTYTGDAQGALDEVYTNSANWDGSYTTLTANSATWTSTNNTVSQRSGNWNKTYNTVYGNSAAWGGQALPISAGPGVKMDVVDDTLVFSNDETVLWSGNMSWGQNGSLTDSVKNYERIRFYIEETNRHRKSVNEIVLTDLSNANLREFSLNLYDATTSYFGNYFTVYQINEVGDSITSVSGRQWWYNPWTSTAINGSVDRGLILTKVVGVNRTASN